MQLFVICDNALTMHVTTVIKQSVKAGVVKAGGGFNPRILPVKPARSMVSK